VANAINNSEQVVGSSQAGATEWSGGSVIGLRGLPGSIGTVAFGIDSAGDAVGDSLSPTTISATEWSGGSVINMEGLSGFTLSEAFGMNSAGEAVGYSRVDLQEVATEWTGGLGGSIINLKGLPGSLNNRAYGINDEGQVVGWSQDPFIPPPLPVPEPSTWAMMLLGFAVLGYAGYRRSARVLGQNARLSIYQPDL
jgi:uncharacterized membrane protein